jgi:hypothetical protein
MNNLSSDGRPAAIVKSAVAAQIAALIDLMHASFGRRATANRCAANSAP